MLGGLDTLWADAEASYTGIQNSILMDAGYKRCHTPETFVDTGFPTDRELHSLDAVFEICILQPARKCLIAAAKVISVSVDQIGFSEF